ncbi:archaetidylserine decarboxylase [Methylohalomonas lacus]|nr:archaetidylserine decarboxylase [Methylohalomonas lacus]
MDRRSRCFNRLQSWLPQQWLSRLMYHATRWTWQPWKNWQINWFIRRYGVNMAEAEQPQARAYPHFNAFFTRALRPGVRPMPDDTQALVSPVDGRISQIGTIHGNRLIQAKGHDYTVEQLLAADAQLAGRFQNGGFVTIYLAPRDYHRIHMPCDGRLERMIHVPGRRFAVNETSAAGIPGLFARNERLVNIFTTPAGPLALVMVGALFVGSMETVWTDTLAARASGELGDYDYHNARIHLRRGAEMGRFNMGSTVILLTGWQQVEWLTAVQPGRPMHFGQTLGRLLNADDPLTQPA